MFIFDYIFCRFYKKFDRQDEWPFLNACLYLTFVFVALTQAVYLKLVSELICPAKLEHLYYYGIFWLIFFTVLYWKRKSKVLTKAHNSKWGSSIPFWAFWAIVFPSSIIIGFCLGFLCKSLFLLI